MKSSIIITGGNGFVGSTFSFGTPLGRSQLDVTRPNSIINAIDTYKPDVIIHLASIVDIATCQNQPNLAYETNVNGTYNVAAICRKKSIYLVYLSTCLVFDGQQKTPYTETSIPHPISIYGRTKVASEYIVSDIASQSLVVRTGWLFGSTMKNKNKFIDMCIDRFRRKKIVSAVSDRYGSPTYIPDLTDSIFRLINRRRTGYIHIVNSGLASYYDLALAIKNTLSIRTGIIRAIKSADFDSANAYRGTMEGLISKELVLRPWQDALQSYITKAM